MARFAAGVLLVAPAREDYVNTVALAFDRAGRFEEARAVRASGDAISR